MKAAERFETQRLVLRRPLADDAQAIFARYANDKEVTRYLAWPRHETIEATNTFLEFSDAQWHAYPCGPYLVESRHDGRLLGSSGLAFENQEAASTGYVFAKDAWGLGYATETLRAMVEVARALHVTRLYALCHVDHAASWRVLEKCGFTREALLRRGAEFPNLEPDAPRDVHRYTFDFGDKHGVINEVCVGGLSERKSP